MESIYYTYVRTHAPWLNLCRRGHSLVEFCLAQLSAMPVRTHITMIRMSNWHRTKYCAHNSCLTNCISHYYFWLFLLCSFMIISALFLLFSIAPISAFLYVQRIHSIYAAHITYKYLIRSGPKDLPFKKVPPKKKAARLRFLLYFFSALCSSSSHFTLSIAPFLLLSLLTGRSPFPPCFCLYFFFFCFILVYILFSTWQQ